MAQGLRARAPIGKLGGRVHEGDLRRRLPLALDCLRVQPLRRSTEIGAISPMSVRAKSRQARGIIWVSTNGGERTNMVLLAVRHDQI